MRFTPLLAFTLTVAAGAGCDDTSGGVKGETCTTPGRRCATPACSNFPTTPGCDDIAPTTGYCPIDHPHCFDPTTSPSYCDPATAVCGNAKVPLPAMCPAHPCNRADVEVCHDVNDDLFCRGDYRCLPFDCAADGGLPDGAPGDGGIPDAAPAEG